MAITKKTLLAGLGQLNTKYQKRGVKVTLQTINGHPAYIMHGDSPTPPPGLPGQMQLPDQSGKDATLPIIWDGMWYGGTAQKNLLRSPRPAPNPDSADLATSMWYGGTKSRNLTPSVRPVQTAPVTQMPELNERDLDREIWGGGQPMDRRSGADLSRRDVAVEYTPGDPDRTPLAGPIPTTDITELQLSVDVATYADHGFWDINFDVEADLCCTYYDRPNVLLKFVVPEDRMLFIDGWGFYVIGTYPVGWVFNVRFLRDGETLLSYDEVVTDPTNPDPGKRCLLSGTSDLNMDTVLRLDRNQTFQVIITLKGLYPYISDPLAPMCGIIGVLMHGHQTALLDNRDGTPRPKDVGLMRDDLNGDGCLDDVTAEDVQDLMRYMEGATANAVVPDTSPPDAGAVQAAQAAGSMTASDVDFAEAQAAEAKAADAQVEASISQTAQEPPPEKKAFPWWMIAAGAVALNQMGDDVDNEWGSDEDDIYGSSLNPSALDP
jgi:hypothetical protein